VTRLIFEFAGRGAAMQRRWDRHILIVWNDPGLRFVFHCAPETRT